MSSTGSACLLRRAANADHQNLMSHGDIVALTGINAAQTIFASGSERKVNHIVVRGRGSSGANATLDFKTGGSLLFRVSVPILGRTLVLPGFTSPATGLTVEALVGGGAALNVTVAYFDGR